MSKIYIDLETRSELDLKEVGLWNYARHPSTSILCMAFAYDANEVQLWLPGMEIPDFLKLPVSNRFIAHNAEFEAILLFHKMNARFMLKWDCTAVRCASAGLPRSLKEAGKALNLPIIKDMEGRKTMLKLSKPRKPTKKDPSLWHNDSEDFKTLYSYCAKDVAVCRAIDKVVPQLEDSERRYWSINNQINSLGVPLDMKSVESAIMHFEKYELEKTEELKKITDGTINSINELKRIKEFISIHSGIKVDGLDSAKVEELLINAKLDTLSRRVLELRQELSGSAVKKLYTMRNQVAEDGRVRLHTMFYGGHTGRDSGKGVQFQNLVKAKQDDQWFQDLNLSYDVFSVLYPDVTAQLGKMSRGFLQSPEGKTFLVVDFSAIEMRVALWLCGQDQEFRNGEDVYSSMIAYILKKNVKQVEKPERQLGKIIMLSSGYGAGPEKFQAICKSNFSLDITEEEAKRYIYGFRAKYHRVVMIWKAIDEAFKMVINDKKTVVKIRDMELKYHGDFLRLKLLSGRYLTYHGLYLKASDKGSVISDNLGHKFYGSLIFENIVQALCRDLLYNSCEKLMEQLNLQIILKVHDEIVAIEDETKSEWMLNQMEELMVIMPDWCKDMPMRVEGFISKRYTK